MTLREKHTSLENRGKLRRLCGALLTSSKYLKGMINCGFQGLTTLRMRKGIPFFVY